MIEPGDLPTHWEKKLLDALEDPELVTNIKSNRDEFDSDWILVRRLISIYSPELFNMDFCSYDIYKRCATIIQTRCFGWGLPTTVIAPIADSFNHSPTCPNELDIINKRLH